MRLVISNPRATRRDTGFIGIAQDGVKVWVPLANASSKLVGEGDVIVLAENSKPTDDGGLNFISGVSRIAQQQGKPRRVIENGEAVTKPAPWVEFDVPVKVEDPRVTIDLNRIQQLVGKAQAAGAKRVHFKFRDQNNEPIKIHLGRDGKLVITDGGPFGANRFYGKCSGNDWVPTRNTPETVRKAVAAFNADPAAAAKLSGQVTGECCFCSRELETRESVSAGYGPICADKYGLPWGDVSPESGISGVRDRIVNEAAGFHGEPVQHHCHGLSD